MSQWVLDFFEGMFLYPSGDTGPARIAGWVREPFAIDPRRYIDVEAAEMRRGWVITHLPTGFIVGAVRAGRAEAISIADWLLDQADWDFVDAAAGSRANRAVIKQLSATRPTFCHPQNFEAALPMDVD